MLEDEELREREGKEMEIIALATEKAKEILNDYHQYADNVLDMPFLTANSILLKDKETEQ
jgi:hypothetical protein